MGRLKKAFSFFFGMNFAYLLVLGLVIKALVHDLSYPTFLISVPVLAFEGYKLYLNTKKRDPVVLDEEIRKELDNIKAKLNAGSLEKSIKQPVQRYF